MNNEQIKKILDDEYDVSREAPLRSLLKEFYSRRMLSTAIFAWVWAMIFLAGAVYAGIQFFKADQIRAQIMYAAVFVCFVYGVGLMKVFAWEMVNKHSVKREIKRLELSIAELSQTVKDK